MEESVAALPHVAIIRHIAMLPYDISKRNVIVVLSETTVDDVTQTDGTSGGPVYFLQLIEHAGPGRAQVLHDTQLVDVSLAQLQRAQRSCQGGNGGPIFSFLTPTQSGKMVVLGGTAVLNCYQIEERIVSRPGMNGGPSVSVSKLSLNLTNMLGCKYLDIEMRDLR